MKRVIETLVEELSDLVVSDQGETIQEKNSSIMVNKVREMSPDNTVTNASEAQMRDTTTSLLRVKTSDRLRSSRSRSKSKNIKVKQKRPQSSVQQFGNNSQQLQLLKTDFHVTGKK